MMIHGGRDRYRRCPEMPLTRSTDFNLAALYAALDTQRQIRGLTSQQAMHEIIVRSDRPPFSIPGYRAIRMATGVLTCVRWLYGAAIRRNLDWCEQLSAESRF
jgi:hypothetical protein